jgi:hypothetical protein
VREEVIAVPRPITPAEREQVAKLHAAGFGRNEIARTIGRNVASVSKIASQLGLSFDRSATQAATAAKVTDAKARRAQLMHDLLDDAARLRSELWQPYEYVDHGGKDFDEVRWTMPTPSPADKLKLMQAARQALDGSLRLDQHDGDGSNETVGSLLGSLLDDIVTRHTEPVNGDG